MLVTFSNQIRTLQSQSPAACLKTDWVLLVPFFLDRLCDGFPDCPNNEDEGALAQCKSAGELTPNGCCSFPIIGEFNDFAAYHYRCIYTGNSNDSGWFSNRF